MSKSWTHPGAHGSSPLDKEANVWKLRQGLAVSSLHRLGVAPPPWETPRIAVEARGHRYHPPDLGTRPLSNTYLPKNTGEGRREKPGHSEKIAKNVSCKGTSPWPGWKQVGRGHRDSSLQMEIRRNSEPLWEMKGDDDTATSEIK